ncbi:MAG: hypothetical protein JOZ69_17290 [Myxococcales bacterium]|nr:hypothetical protein [Myxococcales bacterium]
MGPSTSARLVSVGLAIVVGCGSSGAAGPEDGGDAGAAASGPGSSDGAAAGDARTGEPSLSGPQATAYFVSTLNLGACFPSPLASDANGLISCRVFYVLGAGDTCAAHPGLSTPSADVLTSLMPNNPVGLMPPTYCALPQLPESAWVNGSCDRSTAPGWCFVSGSAAAPCAQAIVMSSSGALPAGATAVLACATPAPAGTFSGASDPSRVGAACTPSPESSPTFAGFDFHIVVLDEGNPACGSDVCLVNHFQGRTTCPYGQDANGSSPVGVPACTVPGTNTAVRPAAAAGSLGNAVQPQCVRRRPKVSVYCTCRCANGAGKTDDGAAYCSCPSGYSCAPVVPLLQPGEPRAGGYCLPNGTAYNPNEACTPCDASIMNCP